MATTEDQPRRRKKRRRPVDEEQRPVVKTGTGPVPGLEDRVDLLTADRVWVTMDIKVQIVEYEPVGFGAGMSSTVQADETPAEALERIKAIVAEEVNYQRSEFIKMRKKLRNR